MAAYSFLPFITKLIIKYLSEDLDYKQYCDLGKNNLIVKPISCPHCKSSNCLIGHGWYARKGLSGASCGYHPFWIRRFYCKNTRKTIAMHPGFSHTRKRYILQHVISAIADILEKFIAISQIVLNLQVPRQTLKRWAHSFSTMNCEAKKICFHVSVSIKQSIPGCLFVWVIKRLNEEKKLPDSQIPLSTLYRYLRRHFPRRPVPVTGKEQKRFVHRFPN